MQNVSVSQMVYLVFISKDERVGHHIAIDSKAAFVFDIIFYALFAPLLLFFLLFQKFVLISIIVAIFVAIKIVMMKVCGFAELKRAE